MGEPAPEAAASGRDNGQRFGVRYRRGSRGALRAGDIPLIGVVQMDAPTDAAPAAAASAGPTAAAVTDDETEAPAARTKRAPRKKKAAAPAKAAKAAKPEATLDDAVTATAAPPVKRGRSRAKKKAE